MACRVGADKLDAYLDGELRGAEEAQLREHLRGCGACSVDGLERLQLKRAIQAAGQRFQPDAALRDRIQQSLVTTGSKRRTWKWLPALAVATAAAVLVVGVLFVRRSQQRAWDRYLLGELVDQHVTTLASSNPVDVVSSDRHTVKPWFEGKIPFTFNLPELPGTSFVLVGGRVNYLNQAPGAELIFRVRQHQISVFIFQESAIQGLATGETAFSDLSFGIRSWSRGGLRYFVVGDASAQDLDQLSSLLRAAT
jgi:anti-sigma factor RsiW